MRLKLVRVRGYKRFAERASLDTRGHIIAVVGPNEAGKTSLLEAMEHLSPAGKEFTRSEFTDRKEPDEDQWLVLAHYSLEPSDIEAAGDLLPKGDFMYKWYVYKDGGHKWGMHPWPHRDLTLRKRAIAGLRQAADRGWLNELGPYPGDESQPAEELPSFRDEAVRLAESLDHEDDDLDDHVKASVRNFAERLRNTLKPEARKTLQKLPDVLVSTHDAEAEDAPAIRLNRILTRRLPRFLSFENDDRDLKPGYLWSELGSPLPRALAHLLALADCNYDDLREAATTDDAATLQTIERAAEKKLAEGFEAWRQEQLSVVLRADREGLQVLVRDRATDTHTRLDERSQGLRTFVALVAFTSQRAGDVRPVLLVDEAELHLHYAAQADLVRVFERQHVAEMVVYTTHSIGCLPEDLGATIRVVVPTGEERRSQIRNSFWSEEHNIGMSPLMVALGAEVFAFLPARRAVIAEGTSDAILLPSLIREARGPDRADEPLGYQVAPGVSEVPEEKAAELEGEAGTVAYLHDADEAGRKHRRKLPKRAKDEGRVVQLGDGKEAGLCTEDFVSAGILTEAFNTVLSRRTDAPDERLAVKDLPKAGRARKLDEWCKDHGLKPLDHAPIAQEALEVARDRGPLAEPARVKELRKLHQKLLDATKPRDKPESPS